MILKSRQTLLIEQVDYRLMVISTNGIDKFCIGILIYGNTWDTVSPDWNVRMNHSESKSRIIPGHNICMKQSE